MARESRELDELIERWVVDFAYRTRLMISDRNELGNRIRNFTEQARWDERRICGEIGNVINGIAARLDQPSDD